jgi:hypothetical protein
MYFGNLWSSILFKCLSSAFTLVSCWTHYFDPEDGGNMFLRNVGWHSTDYTTLYPRKLYSLEPPLWEPQILQLILFVCIFSVKFYVPSSDLVSWFCILSSPVHPRNIISADSLLFAVPTFSFNTSMSGPPSLHTNSIVRLSPLFLSQLFALCSTYCFTSHKAIIYMFFLIICHTTSLKIKMWALSCDPIGRFYFSSSTLTY